jgi:hypothetical protein
MKKKNNIKGEKKGGELKLLLCQSLVMVPTCAQMQQKKKKEKKKLKFRLCYDLAMAPLVPRNNKTKK